MCILNNTEIRVYNLLVSFSNQYTDCYPPQSFIANKLGITVRQVQRVIASLKSKNFLFVDRNNIQKAKHLNNSYKLSGSPPCRLECRLECRLLIINNNKSYYLYSLQNINNNLYNKNLVTPIGDNQNSFSKTKMEDTDMDIKKKHLSILLEKNLTSVKSEYVFKLFYLLCDEYGYKIPYSFCKKDIGIIKRIVKTIPNDKELKDFFKFIITNWQKLIFKFKIATTVPDLRVVNIKLNELYNEFKSNYVIEDKKEKTSKYIKKEVNNE